jgi:ATP-dependent RNA helicase RhlB
MDTQSGSDTVHASTHVHERDSFLLDEGSMTERLLTEVRFASLDLEPSILRGIEDAGFEYCTLIQAQSLPAVLAGRDVEGQAQTGTGKTAAFLVGIMNVLLREPRHPDAGDGQPRAIVIAPTRELAVQIHRDAEQIGLHTGLRFGVVFGGTGYESQRQMLRDGLDVLIGTPGRLIDYFKQKIYHLNAVRVAVLDEADRMFDLGFIRDIRYLLRRMPPPQERLSLLFSATLSMRVRELAYEHMNSPTMVDARPENHVTVASVSQRLFHVGEKDKIPLLIGLLRRMDVTRTIIFFNTKREAEKVDAWLAGNGLIAGMLTGDVPQKKRLSLLDRFTRGELPILLATDVAARGLHIPNVSHVFNYDLPQDAEDYVHRVGRTARVGAKGDAVSFSCERFCYSLTEIEAFIGQSIPAEVASAELMADPQPPARRRHARQPIRSRGRGGSGASRGDSRRRPRASRS